MGMCRSIHACLCLTAFVATTGSAFCIAQTDVPTDFRRDIKPIFDASCIDCHGPKKQRSGYRLDVRQTAIKGGDSGETAIVPGDSGKSVLVRHISSDNKDVLMPPPGSGKPRLTAEQVTAVRKWIDAGAIWPDDAIAKTADPLDWWSLKPLSKPSAPNAATAKSANPIDAFVAAKLAGKSLTMSPPADSRALARRLHFDLIGLPPTPDELDAFIAESAKNADVAYEALVDRLLASPRYGERWARHWLDVVHYGDTHGYDKDKPRPNAWPYRDYVIRALNADKSYARFVQEQIAGDALFPGTADGVEALGFLAAGPWDYIGHAEVPEGKIDGKIARHLDRDDMVGTAVGALASVTVQCAQCHSHKFDPISQEDYYALQAVFAAIDRTDRPYDVDPAVTRTRGELAARRSELQAREAALNETVRVAGGAELSAIDHRLSTSGAAAAAQKELPQHGWHSNISKDQVTAKWVQVDLGATVDIRRIVLAGCHDDFNGIGAGFGFPVRFRIEASDDPTFGGNPISIADFAAQDHANPGVLPVGFSTTGATGRYVRVTATLLAPRKNDFIFALAELQVLDPDGRNVAKAATVTSADSIETPVRWSRKNLTDDLYPGKSLVVADLAKLKQEREALLLRVTDEATRAGLADVHAQLSAINAAIAKLPPPRVVYAGAIHTGKGTFAGTGASGGKPRPIHLLIRGQVTQPGKEVRPGALSAITALPSRFEIRTDQGEAGRRAALAAWLTDPANPLTWRSIVNRVWQYHFGKGIVQTPNDFGRMGSPPTHPELLDWLAADFRDNGGSLKRLHKLIVTSAAYRQSSSADNANAAAVDIDNHLLWRQNRRKLEAEAVRDAVLAVSGKLDLTMGGPGWQDFVIEHPEHSPHYLYDKADPNDARTWRRSIYRFTVRSQLQPFMTSLDCADPSMRVDKRNESVSPAQALALLNNGFMVTQAEAMAARVWQEAGADRNTQIDRACRLALGRLPTVAEREQMTSFARTSGLANLCRVLLNLNEFVFVD